MSVTITTQDLEGIRNDFPILARTVHGKRLTYLDNASTTHKPIPVLKALQSFYEEFNANIHRGIHTLSEEATELYENARQTVADFINAQASEIIFTKNATESLNLIAFLLERMITKGDEIVVTQLEHHSNFVPWQQLAKRTGAVLKVIPAPNGDLDCAAAKNLITPKTKIVAIAHVSNALGTVTPLHDIIQLAHEQHAIVVVDAAQSVPHTAVDIKELDCDFLAFSGHKLCGPTGIGVLYGKHELLDTFEPVFTGGGAVHEVHEDSTTWHKTPWKFEPGTPNIAGAVGLAAAIRYINNIGMEAIHAHTTQLTQYAVDQLQKLPSVTVYGKPTCGIVSFNVQGIHPHDTVTLLNDDGIAIRGGHHCAMPLMQSLGIHGTCRASFYIYNTKKDIDALIESIKKAREVFTG